MTYGLLMSDISWGIFTFILGVVVIFAGMAFLVLVISAIGLIMKKIDQKKEAKQETPAPVQVVEEKVEPVQEDNEVEDGNLRAAIIAAVMMCLEETKKESGSTCEFVVRRIRRI